MPASRSPSWQPRHRRGFTLIEVMITVAIVAILAAVALPSYFDSVRKARRADAINALTRAQQAQERFRANNPQFGQLFVNVGTATFAAAASGTSGGVASFDSSDGYYAVSITASSATDYTLLALAKANSSQAKDRGCQCLQLAVSGGQVTYSAGGTSGAFNGTVGGCGTISAGAAANACWRK